MGLSGVVALHTLSPDFSALRSEFGDLREEMRRGFTELRTEIARIERSTR